MSDPSEQPPEERGEGRPVKRRPKRSVSPPAFAAVLLALAIGGVLAWLAVSADKSALPTEEAINATLTVDLGDEDSAAPPEHEDAEDEADSAAKSEPPQSDEHEAKTETAHDAAVPSAKSAADHAATAEEDEQHGAKEDTTATLKIPLVAPRTIKEVVALALPDPTLLQETSRGALPIIGPDGREPWREYGRKMPPAGDMPRLAIIVTGLGLSSAATETAIKLAKEVTLSFTPYGADLETDVAKARGAGHEVLLDLPMEPISYPADDPGPHTLLTSLNPSDNIARLEWLLGRFKGYVGVINFMGSRFTVSPESLRPILHALKERGLMFVDSRSTSKSVAAGLAKQMGLPRALNDRFLDHEPTRGAIDQSFAEAEGTARARGVALVVARPFPVTLERLAAWLPMLESRGIEIIPVTALADIQVNR
ncbi:MAG: divergent polysaccharide deacetylase family protein [Rhodospirillaceae bacterium]|nr:divergent polysaccharide deacetylase family protein [Rhodospirillaceae bacterium]MBT3927231.1 divergent polysaccharide deacetylase family protein [Rhodospirillaceae bacterium]